MGAHYDGFASFDYLQRESKGILVFSHCVLRARRWRKCLVLRLESYLQIVEIDFLDNLHTQLRCFLRSASRRNRGE